MKDVARGLRTSLAKLLSDPGPRNPLFKLKDAVSFSLAQMRLELWGQTGGIRERVGLEVSRFLVVTVVPQNAYSV